MPGTILIDPLFQPALWTDEQTPTPVTPPPAWQALEHDERWYFGGVTLQTVGKNKIDYTSAQTLPNQLGFAWEILEISATAILFRYIDKYGDVQEQNLGTAVGSGTIGIDDFALEADADFPFVWWITDVASTATNHPPITTVAVGGCDVSYNCDCETDPNARTLLSMRTELATRAGYATQALKLPPGIVLQFNSYLKTAQEYLYEQYKPLQTRRFYSWRLREGVRYYGLRDNGQCCDVTIDPTKVEGAWIQDPNNTWWPLVWGIDPTFYTLDMNLGWPNYIEIRQCIELFPAPMAGGYKLWLKGNFGLLPFSVDADVSTIDAGIVLNWAIGLAKLDKGDRSAGDPTPGRETGYFGMAVRSIKRKISATHKARRYIPGTSAIPIPTPPVMVHFEGS